MQTNNKNNDARRYGLAFFLLALFVVMLAGPAFAATKTTPKPADPTQEQTQAQDQQQAQQQKQDQAQDQSQGQSQSMGDQQNMQSVSFSDRQQVHSAIAPSVFASSPCFTGGSAALGLKNLNIGGGKTKVDPECELREAVRLLAALNERELAVIAICTSAALTAALGERCKPTIADTAGVDDLRNRVATLEAARQADTEKCAESNKRVHESCQAK